MRPPRPVYLTPDMPISPLPVVAESEIAVFSRTDRIKIVVRQANEDKIWENGYAKKDENGNPIKKKKIPYFARQIAVSLAFRSNSRKGLKSSLMGRDAAIVLDIDDTEPGAMPPTKEGKSRDSIPSAHRTALAWAVYCVRLGLFSYGKNEKLQTEKIFYFTEDQRALLLAVFEELPKVNEIIAAQLADPFNPTAGRTPENKNYYVNVSKL
jgi:hypothetical protein